MENERLKLKESQEARISSPSVQPAITNQSANSTTEHFTDTVNTNQSSSKEQVHQLDVRQQSGCSDACRNTCISCNINLTNENQSLIKGMCDSYSGCRNSECVCVSNVVSCKEPSPCFEPVSSTCQDTLSDLDLSTEFLTGKY